MPSRRRARRAGLRHRGAGHRPRGEAVRPPVRQQPRHARGAAPGAEPRAARARPVALRAAALAQRGRAPHGHDRSHQRVCRRPGAVPHRPQGEAGGGGRERDLAGRPPPVRGGEGARVLGRGDPPAGARGRPARGRAQPDRHPDGGRRDRPRRPDRGRRRGRAGAGGARGDRRVVARPRQHRPPGGGPRQPDPRRGLQAGRVRHPHRALREGLLGPVPGRRGAGGVRQPAPAGARDGHHARQDHGQPRHRGAPPAAERPHQDPHPPGRPGARPRLPRLLPAHAVGREDRPAPAGQGPAHARHDEAGLRGGAAAPLPGRDRASPTASSSSRAPPGRARRTRSTPRCPP